MTERGPGRPEITGPQSRLVVETLTQVVTNVEIVEIVAEPERSSLGLHAASWSAPGLDHARTRIGKRVFGQLKGHRAIGSFSCVVAGVAWGVLAEPIRVEGGEIVGMLVVARRGRTWSGRERALAESFASLLSQGATLATHEGALLTQRRLDELVGRVAERLMSATSRTRKDVLSWTIRVLAEFLGADEAFVRRNDHPRGVSILEAQWPPDEAHIPETRGEVPFDADPMFGATRNLREPYPAGVAAKPGDCLARVEEGCDVARVDRVCIPLLLADTTWGVLGFSHFESHGWTPGEIGALRAIGSLLMQLQARIDAEERTAYNAVHDELTGLPNRRALLAELESRLGAERKTAILFFDLDRFKVMNDFLGHASGDRVLSVIAARIRESTMPNDFAARLGGDEFVVLFDEVSDDTEAVASAERILRVIRTPIEFAGQQVIHAASVGIVLSKLGLKDGMELLGWADVALYAAKRRGGNQAVVFDEVLKESVSERSRTELTLREAIEGDGLRLHYQPEVDLCTGALLALEARVRWQHPTRGLLSASEFINIAEESGLVVEMGRWVFAEASRQLAAWEREHPNLSLVIRVNTSPAQFVGSGLVEFVENCLRQHRIRGTQLCIQMKEHAVLQDPEQTARVLRGFGALGVEVAVDDFGSSYASFAELKRLPMNYLKLCAAFVQGIDTDPRDKAIVETIIQLGRALDLGVIAKGIESKESIDTLVDLGCFRGQGYLISMPMSADELAPVLRAGSIPLASRSLEES